MFGRKKEREIFVSAVIVAAGSSTRMGENKLLMQIGWQTVIEKTLEVFDKTERITEIILVCRQDDFVDFSKFCKVLKTPSKIVIGGQTRTHSTLNGINACNEKTEIIAIHDGARPLITQDIIDASIECADKNGASIPVVPVKDTIKILENGVVERTLNRENLFAVQTPQTFKSTIIKKVTEQALTSEQIFSDDASCAEAQGVAIHTVQGSYDNIKITTLEDIALASLIIDRRGF
ncbi:MAG: 2-C-methyl-D-erythritol 4-phosphate cytidylyltransferase [Clostridia bacterium]